MSMLSVFLMFGVEHSAPAPSESGAALVWQILIAAFFVALFFLRNFLNWLRKRKGSKN
jgi:hypothetical protein